MSCGKEINCEVWPRILLLFRKKFNKFSKTGAQMLDSIYYYNYFGIMLFLCESIKILPYKRKDVISVFS